MLTLPEFSQVFGPPKEAPSSLPFSNSPYAPFSKGDKLGKVADWAMDSTKDKDQKRTMHGRGFRDPYHAYGASSSSFFINEEPESSLSFSVVDSTAKAAPKQQKPQSSTVLKSRRAAPAQLNRNFKPSSAPQVTPLAQQKNVRKVWQADKKHREPSVTIGADWKLIQTNSFSELLKLRYAVGKPTVIAKAGEVPVYDKPYEKSTSLGAKKLQDTQRTPFNVTASEDPVIETLAKEKAGTVYATDRIVALLMCATRTVMPWEIIITKKDGELFFDKRDDGPLDFLTVDENSANAPSDTSDVKINTPHELGIEATYVNVKYAANVVTDKLVKFDQPNPFSDDEADADSEMPKGYIYTKTNIEDDESKPPLNLIMRTEVDAIGDDNSYLLLRTLNEYGGPNKALEWKDRYTNHRGAIATNEMKNNSSKLSQWAAQGILSGAKAIKLGFVSRVSAKDRTQHELVGIMTRDPEVMAKDLSLNLENGWGIVRSIVNICLEVQDGKYVLLRDPNNASLKFYSVPQDAEIN